MLITITVISILAVSTLAYFAKRILPLKVCPICAGVFITWVWLLGAHFLGYPVDLTVPALLMGGSVVGIAYSLEKRSLNISAERLLLWKVLFIPAGFIAAYSILEGWWIAFLAALAFLLAVSTLFLRSSGGTKMRDETVGDIEKKMKDCC
ncbi:MAG: hypothetical protein Q7S05_02600 [bacterium]|nr:hypothetical protein [bacterium]